MCNLLKKPNSANYYYFNSKYSSYQLSPYNVSQSSKGAIMATMMQLYTYPTTQNVAAYAMYNDEYTGMSISSSYAHAKGILLAVSGNSPKCELLIYDITSAIIS